MFYHITCFFPVPVVHHQAVIAKNKSQVSAQCVLHQNRAARFFFFFKTAFRTQDRAAVPTIFCDLRSETTANQLGNKTYNNYDKIKGVAQKLVLK